MINPLSCERLFVAFYYFNVLPEKVFSRHENQDCSIPPPFLSILFIKSLSNTLVWSFSNRLQNTRYIQWLSGKYNANENIMTIVSKANQLPVWITKHINFFPRVNICQMNTPSSHSLLLLISQSFTPLTFWMYLFFNVASIRLPLCFDRSKNRDFSRYMPPFNI